MTQSPAADYTPPVTPTYPVLYSNATQVKYSNGTDVYYE